MDAAAKQVNDTWGSVDILAANAVVGTGTVPTTKASESSTEDLLGVMERDLYGTVYSVNAVAPYMKEQKPGKIVTVSGHRTTVPT